MSNQEQIETIGQRIKRLRKETGETQAELGMAINISQNSISKIESGEVALTLDNLIRIAEHYHVSTDYICIGINNATLLETLTQFISLEFVRPGSEYEQFNYPLLKINNALFTYLFETASHKQRATPFREDILNDLLKQEIDNFYKHKNINNPLEVVPIPQDLIYYNNERKKWKQSDLMREVTRHFSTPKKVIDKKEEPPFVTETFKPKNAVPNEDTSNKDSNN